MRKPGLFVGVLSTFFFTGSLLVAAPSSAESAPLAETKVTLSKAEQPKLNRPELAELKQSAEKAGISLERAIDQRASQLKPPGDASLPDLKIDDLTLVELEDLKLLAKGKGISLEKAIELYGGDDLFIETTAKIFERFPGQRAGVGFVNTSDGGRGGWIAFKDEIPTEAVKLAQSLPMAVELVGGKGYTEDELEREAARSVQGIPKGVASVTAYDVKTGEITIQLSPKNAAKIQPEVLAEQVQPSESANPKIKFKVEVTEEADVEPQDSWLRGGGTLTSCTVGFNIYNGDLRSPSTAGHCASSSGYGDLTYSNHSNDGGSTTVKFKTSHEGSEGDFARYGPGGMTSTDTYYYDWNSKRYVDQVATYDMTNVKDKPVCHFGKTTGASCAEISNVGITVTYTNGKTYSRMVQTKNCTNGGGDSGGPWYWGGNAYGLHSAAAGATCYFSQARFMPNAISGWKVVTR